MKNSCVSCILLLILFYSSFGQIPQTLSFQGVLTDNTGNPVTDGDYNLTFRLYETESEGTAVWTEGQTSTVVNGIFNVILGKVTSLSIPFDKSYWLGISIDSGAELSPRIELTSTAYSLNSRSVYGNSNVFPSEGNVGIGTTLPEAKLQVGDGQTNNTSISIRGSRNNSWTASSLNFGDELVNYRYRMGIRGTNEDDNANLRLIYSTVDPQVFLTAVGVYPETLNDTNYTLGLHNNDFYIDTFGNIGIGTMDPNTKLEVSGMIQSNNGGFKFPDGSVQTTASLGGNGSGGGDITAVNAGNGLTGGATEGEANIDVGAGIGINVSEDSVSIDTIFVDERYINEGQINSITTEMIQNDAISQDKILPNITSSINGVNNDGSNIDLVAGSNISIVPDDGNNQITISASGGSTTLDQAYDHVGSGAGRTITADAGAVNIEGPDGLTVAGKVGIGKTNPDFSLDVQGGSSVAIQAQSSGSNAISASSTAGGGYAAGNFNAAGEGTYGIRTQSSNYDALYASSNSPSSTAIRAVGNSGAYAGIFNGGNVGIGINDPQEKLQVNGTVHSTSGGFKFPDGTTQTTAANMSGNFIKKDTPDTSRGTNSIPMLLISNLADGDGVNGRSVSGDGISGRSDNKNGTVGWTGASDMSGVFGFSTNGRGVVGRSDNNDGMVGWSGASDKSGVYGHSEVGTGVTGHSQANSGYGISGLATGTNGHAVNGYANGSNGIGVFGQSDQGVGIDGRSSSVNEWTPAIYGRNVGAGDGVYGWSQNRHGTYGVTYSSDQNHAGVYGINNGAGPAVMADGDFVVTGAFKGNVGPNGGGSFPRPAYDSGWQSIAQSEEKLFTHNIGGNVNNYVVNLQFFSNQYGFGINCAAYGMDFYDTGSTVEYEGAYYLKLTNVSISVSRNEFDRRAEQVRVRIWVYN